MPNAILLDAAGNKRPIATMPGYNKGRRPATKGRHKSPEPLPVDDVQRLISACAPQGPSRLNELAALRLKCLIILLWRSGLRISEALALTEHDLDEDNRTIVVRNGKGGKRRLVMMDAWAWRAIRPWIEVRRTLPPGEIFCVIRGRTAGRAMYSADVRRELAKLRTRAGIRRRVHAHGFRHTHAVDLRNEGMDLLTIQASLGHAHVGVTQIYLRGLSTEELLKPIANRPEPLVPLRL